MSLAQFVDVMALVRKQRRGIEELVHITSMSEGAIASYLELLRSEGHVYVCELRRNRRGSPTPIYCWQDVIYGEADVQVASGPRPPSQTPPSRQ